MNHLGADAELVAATYLQQEGLALVSSNYRCRFGEIDLIMRDGKTLVFVEVRMRSNSTFGGARMSITQSKRQKLIRTAEHFLQQHGGCACRFDVVLMTRPNIENIEWLQNAFDA